MFVMNINVSFAMVYVNQSVSTRLYMTTKYKQQLIENGVNVSIALDRFMGNETLFERFLQMFLKDKSLSLLMESLEKGNIHDAFVQAHTMKGVVANLEIGPLLEILVPLTDQLRENNTDNVEAQVEELHRRYIVICDLIRNSNT